jgi:hypothetical protein
MVVLYFEAQPAIGLALCWNSCGSTYLIDVACSFVITILIRLLLSKLAGGPGRKGVFIWDIGRVFQKGVS